TTWTALKERRPKEHPVSGTESDQPRLGRQRRQLVCLLVVGYLLDPALVALTARERRGQESLHDRRGLRQGVHPSPDPHHVRVVVLPYQSGGLHAPRQGGPHSGHLVRRDLLTVTRASDHHPEAAGVGDHPVSNRQAEDRAVIVRIAVRRSDVDNRVPQGRQPGSEVGLQLVTGVIAAEIDTHDWQSVRFATPPVHRAANTRPARALGVNHVLLRGIFKRARFTCTKSSTLTGAISTASWARPASTSSHSQEAG